MAKTLRENRILLVLFLSGFAAALVLCAMRFVMERSNSRATALMSFADIEILSEARGISPDEYVPELEKAGIYPIVAYRLERDSLVIFPPNLYLPGESGAYSDFDMENGVVGLVEDKYQITFNPIEGFIPDGSVSMVKVFYLLPSFAKRYATLGYDGAQEVENILYRALTDRNIRVLWITPFIHSQTGEMISDPAEYKSVMDNLARRVSPHGITLGREFSVFSKDYLPMPGLVVLSIWGIAAAGVFLLNSFLKIRRGLNRIIVCAGIAASSVYYWLPDLAVYGAALAAAIIFPCLGVWFLSEKLPWETDGGFLFSKTAGSFVTMLLSSMAFSVTGGLFIGALQSSTEYLLSITSFRGVKLSQIAPILFAVIILLRGLYGGGGIKGVVKEILSGGKFILALFSVVLAMAAVYYILRTGDGMVSITVTEQRFRNLLEYYLIARPRTAEFLIAWPCLAIAIALIRRRYLKIAWPFAILVSPGLASVANTFCHSRSPLWLSLVRTALGAGIGILIGVLAVLLLGLLLSKKRKTL